MWLGDAGVNKCLNCVDWFKVRKIQTDLNDTNLNMTRRQQKRVHTVWLSVCDKIKYLKKNYIFLCYMDR